MVFHFHSSIKNSFKFFFHDSKHSRLNSIFYHKLVGVLNLNTVVFNIVLKIKGIIFLYEAYHLNRVSHRASNKKLTHAHSRFWKRTISSINYEGHSMNDFVEQKACMHIYIYIYILFNYSRCMNPIYKVTKLSFFHILIVPSYLKRRDDLLHIQVFWYKFNSNQDSHNTNFFIFFYNSVYSTS